MNDVLTLQFLRKLLEELDPIKLELCDDSIVHESHYPVLETVSHLTISISSRKFDGLTDVACHRLIYKALDKAFKLGLHALSIKIIR